METLSRVSSRMLCVHTPLIVFFPDSISPWRRVKLLNFIRRLKFFLKIAPKNSKMEKWICWNKRERVGNLSWMMATSGSSINLGLRRHNRKNKKNFISKPPRRTQKKQKLIPPGEFNDFFMIITTTPYTPKPTKKKHARIHERRTSDKKKLILISRQFFVARFLLELLSRQFGKSSSRNHQT
jgi:hypothetical protein